MVSAEFLLGKCRRKRGLIFAFPPGFSKGRKPKAVKMFCSKKRLRDGAGWPRRRAGGGGPWRAFVSEQCKGVKRAAFSALACQYALPKEEQTRLEAVGRFGAKIPRFGGKAFGVVARDLRGDVADQRLLRLAACRPEQQEMVVAEPSAMQVLAVPTLAAAAIVKRAKTDCKVLWAIERKQAHVAAETLVNWREKDSIRERDRLVVTVPSLATHVVALSSLPSAAPSAHNLRWDCPLELHLARLVGMRKFLGARPVMQAWTSEWECRHFVIRHADQAPLKAEPRPNYRSKPSCLAAQHCLSGQSGDKLWELKSWDAGAMKTALPM